MDQHDTKQLDTLSEDLRKPWDASCASSVEPELRQCAVTILKRTAEDSSQVDSTRILNKLSTLYSGHVAVPALTDSFESLADVELTPEQTEFLSLGIN